MQNTGLENKPIKISVITLHSAVNYGSVLQTYATKRVLEKFNCDVEFVDYTRDNITDQAYADRMQERFALKAVRKATFGVFNKTINAMALRRVKQRAKPMRDFIRKNVRLTARQYRSMDELRRDPPQADVYCTGSDQVWNSIWNGGIEEPYFLEYAPEGKKRIAYAASIGRDNIDESESCVIEKLLKKYTAISMREKSGVEILNRMGISATWVIDPTLMLSRDEWMEVAEPVLKGEKRFLLAYVLNWTEKISRIAHKIAKENGWEILRICKNRIGKLKADGTKVVVVSSVGQMLSYFDQAACVITDSFHATAFSINFHKSFIVVPPARFSTRLNSILSLTGMEKCIAENIESVHNIESIEWSKTDKILENERQKAYQFLMNALEISK